MKEQLAQGCANYGPWARQCILCGSQALTCSLYGIQIHFEEKWQSMFFPSARAVTQANHSNMGHTHLLKSSLAIPRTSPVYAAPNMKILSTEVGPLSESFPTPELHYTSSRHF